MIPIIYPLLSKVKKYWYVGATLIVLLLVLVFKPLQQQFHDYTDQLLRARLSEMVDKQTKGIYYVDYESVRYNVFTQQLKLGKFLYYPKDTTNLRVDTNATKNKFYFGIYIDELEIKLVDQFEFFTTDQLRIKDIKVQAPDVKVLNQKVKRTELHLGKLTGNLYEAVTQYLQVFELQNLKVDSATLTYYVNSKDYLKQFDFQPFSFSIRDFKLNEGELAEQSKKLLFTEDFELNSGKQEFVLADSSHKVSFDRFGISLKKQFMELHNFKITPIGDSTERSISAYVPTIRFKNLDFNKAYHTNEIEMNKLLVERPAVIINLGQLEQVPESDSIANGFSQTDSILAQIFKTINVDRLVLTRANVNLTFKDKNRRKNDMLISGLSYKCSNLLIDSSSIVNFKMKDFSRNYKMQVFEVKHEISDNGLLTRAFNIDYSSITRVLDIDGLYIHPDEGKIKRNFRKGSKQAQLKKIEIERIHLSNFRLDELIDNKKVKLTSTRLVRPNITVLYDTSFVKDTVVGAKTQLMVFPSLLDTLFARSLKIVDADIFILDAADGKTEFARIEDVNLFTPNIRAENLKGQDDWLEALDRSGLKTSSAFLNIPKMDEKINWKAFDYSASKRKIEIQGLKYKRTSSSVNVSATLKKFSVDRFTPKKLIKEKNYSLGNLILENGNVDVVQKQTFKENRSDLLDKLEFDSVAISNLSVLHSRLDTIKEKIEKLSVSAGKVSFKKDSTNKRNIRLDYLSLNGKKGLISIDQNRHYLEFDDLLMSAKDSLLLLSKLELKPVIDKRRHGKNPIIRSSIEAIQVNGFQYGSNHFLQNLRARSINICSPQLRTSRYTSEKTARAGKSFIQLHEWFASSTGIDQISYGGLNIENGLVDLRIIDHSIEDRYWHFSVPQYDLKSTGFVLDSNQRNSDRKLFYAESHELTAYQAHQLFPDSSRDFTFGKLYYNTRAQYFALSDVDFKYAFYRGDSSKQLEIASKIPLFEVEGLKPIQVTNDKVVNLKRAHLKNPKVNITQYHKKSPYVSRELEIEESGQDEVAIKNLIFNELQLTDGNITWEFEDTNRKSINIQHVDLNGDAIKMNLQEDNQLPKFGDIELSFGDFEQDVMQDFYRAGVDSFYLNTKTQNVKLFGSRLTPRYGIFEFAKRAGWEKSRLEMYAPELQFENFDIKKLIYDNQLRVGLIRTDSLWVRNFKNKNFDMKERFIPMPTIALSKAPLNIKIDSVSLNNGYVEHRQISKNGVRSGTLRFTDLNASLNNITNDSASVLENDVSQLTASTKLMDDGLINAKITFYLEDSIGSFNGKADIGQFRPIKLNEYIEHTAYVKIRKGIVNGGQITMGGNDKFGVGQMRLLYKNLHVDFLNPDTSKGKGMGVLMKTFLANRVVNTKNPHLFITKNGDVFYERDTARAIFHYWGRLAMSGVASSTGVVNNKKEQKKLEKEIKRLRKEELRKEKAIRRKEEEEEEQALSDAKK